MTKKIYIAYTGGTIGCIQTPKGQSPASRGDFSILLADLNKQHKNLPEYDIHEFKELIVSPNATQETWKQIAADIADKYHKYDGFVVLHGTDTMAYSASALSYMLSNLNKPVIFTGAQVPLSQPNNDAENNFVNALNAASSNKLSEVCICFANRIIRGNRAIKIHANDFFAFNSPNLDLLATISNDRVIHYSAPIADKPVMPFELLDIEQNDTILLKLFPGISADFIARVLTPAPKGVILECYGAGNPPSDEGIMALIKSASDQGTVFVDITQCYAGGVAIEKYATGSALSKAGAISGGDMTTEAAFSKLSFLIGRGLNPKMVRHLMTQNLAGEISI